jgi:hypothetical protein
MKTNSPAKDGFWYRHRPKTLRRVNATRNLAKALCRASCFDNNLRQVSLNCNLFGYNYGRQVMA